MAILRAGYAEKLKADLTKYDLLLLLTLNVLVEITYKCKRLHC